MAFLPSFSVIQSGGKYLSLTENIPAGLPTGFVKFGDDPIWSPRVKFAVEPAKTGDGRFVHIRSCYNNKYLVIKRSEKNSWIVASSAKQEEDDSKDDSCTLFEAYSYEDGEATKSVRLRHVQVSKENSLLTRDDTQQGVVASSDGSVFNVIDWNSVVILPDNVAFRSEELDGNYLRSINLYNGQIFQTFQEGLDNADPLVANQLLPETNGNYRIMDLFTRKLWRRRDNWIKGEDERNSESLFSFVQIQDNVVAIRSLGNNRFCGPVTEDQSVNCLNASYPNISRQTRLIVEECVIRREISNIEYRLNDGRIYDEQILEINYSVGENGTAVENTMILDFSYTDSRTSSWSNSKSRTYGVGISLEVDIIPFISKATIEGSAEFGSTREWGEEKTTTTTRGASYNVTIPPFTTVKVSHMCSRATCDVPFNYTQRDLLTSGQWVSTKKYDGSFKGINSFNFYFESTVVEPDDQGRRYV